MAGEVDPAHRVPPLGQASAQVRVSPCVLAEAVHERDRAARLSLGRPGLAEKLRSAAPLQLELSMNHRALPALAYLPLNPRKSARFTSFSTRVSPNAIHSTGASRRYFSATRTT